jgi:hypothetical protein
MTVVYSVPDHEADENALVIEFITVPPVRDGSAAELTPEIATKPDGEIRLTAFALVPMTAVAATSTNAR